MRRFITALAAFAVASGSVLTSAATATADTAVPVATQLTAEQFTAEYQTAVETFGTTFPSGQAVKWDFSETLPKGNVSGGSIVVNPDGSYTSRDTGTTPSKKRMFMCLPPVKTKQECYEESKPGKWVKTSAQPVEEGMTTPLFAQVVVDESVKNQVSEIEFAAKRANTTPTYSVTTVEGVQTFIASYTGAKGTKALVFSFPENRFDLAIEDASGDSLTMQVSPVAPVEVFRPTGDQIDADGTLWRDMTNIAKTLEYVYTNNNVYPKDTVRVTVGKGNTFRICYNRADDPFYYTILGSADGGKTYYVYKSDDGGLNMTPVDNKRAGLPSCKSLRTNTDTGKWHSMVKGPSVLSASNR